MHCNNQLTFTIGSYRDLDTQFVVAQDNVNGRNCVYEMGGGSNNTVNDSESSVTLCVEGNGYVVFLYPWYFLIVLCSVSFHPLGNIINSCRSYKLWVHCRPTLFEIV